MNEDRRAKLEERLAELLPGAETVRVTGAASVGAQRSTLFIDVTGEGGVRPAVAQVAAGPLAVADLEVEASLIRAAARAGVRVPEVLACDPAGGTLVTARVEGESIPRRILRRVEADPELGSRLAVDCAEALATLHRIPTGDFERLPDLCAPEEYHRTLVETLEALSTPHPSFRLGLNWLARHAPATRPVATLVHGDFRNGNLLVDDRGLAAVLDWELAHRGDPMEDLAWLCLRTWRFGRDDAEAGGFAPLETLRTAYEKAGGVWREDGFRWWTVARTIWWGLGLARQAQAFLEGHSSSIVLAASGRRVVELEYDLLELISRAEL